MKTDTQKPIIVIEHLSKEYRKGADGGLPYKTLRDVLTHPIRTFKEARSRTKKPLFKALSDVNLTIHKGDVIGIIGRNGAGKSTLLKILSKVTAPTAGQVTLYGRIGSLLEVGTGFHPELTGRENVYMNGAILGMSRQEIDQKFDEIIEFSGIGEFIDTPIKRYSSGMKARLAFSVAAHLDPEILIIDEVLAVGDQAFQKKCLGKMQDVAGAGRTVLFVSHNMSTIRQLCNRVVVMDQGQIICDETVIDKAISVYLDQEKQNSSFAWVNKNNTSFEDIFKPLSITLKSENSDINPIDLDANSDLSLEIEFEILKDIKGLTTGYALVSETGQHIYSTYITDHKDSMHGDFSKGTYVISQKIPPNILNDGEYRALLLLRILDYRHVLKVDNSPISISFCIGSNKLRSGWIRSKTNSEIAPIMEWNKRKVA